MFRKFIYEITCDSRRHLVVTNESGLKKGLELYPASTPIVVTDTKAEADADFLKKYLNTLYNSNQTPFLRRNHPAIFTQNLWPGSGLIGAQNKSSNLYDNMPVAADEHTLDKSAQRSAFYTVMSEEKLHPRPAHVNNVSGVHAMLSELMQVPETQPNIIQKGGKYIKEESVNISGESNIELLARLTRGTSGQAEVERLQQLLHELGFSNPDAAFGHVLNDIVGIYNPQTDKVENDRQLAESCMLRYYERNKPAFLAEFKQIESRGADAYIIKHVGDDLSL